MKEKHDLFFLKNLFCFLDEEWNIIAMRMGVRLLKRLSREYMASWKQEAVTEMWAGLVGILDVIYEGKREFK